LYLPSLPAPNRSTTLRRVEPQQLRERIAAFPRWNYRFDFDGGVSTPVGDPARINRNRERRSYFFQRLLDATGGSLRGRR
jgi:hypothetical protein